MLQKHHYQCVLQTVQTVEGFSNRTTPHCVAPFIPKRSNDLPHVHMMTSLVTSSCQNNITSQKTQVPDDAHQVQHITSTNLLKMQEITQKWHGKTPIRPTRLGRWAAQHTCGIVQSVRCSGCTAAMVLLFCGHC